MNTFVFLFLVLVGNATAATIAAVSTSYADVHTAVLAAARGDTVTVPAGTSNWGTNGIGLSKGINLLAAGRDQTIITGTSTFIAISPDTMAIANEETIRVEGFTFDGSNTSLNHVSVQGASSNATKPFKNLAVGNCRFKNSQGATTAGSGVFLIKGQVRGVIYGNILDRCLVCIKALGNNDSTAPPNPVASAEWANTAFWYGGNSLVATTKAALGTVDNLYFEDNTIQWSSSFTNDGAGWIESGQGGRIVARYNTWNFANISPTDLWDIHGFQNFPGNGQTGTMFAEYYGNTLTNCNQTGQWIVHRGSWGLFFNNIKTGGATAGAITAQQYGNGDVGGSGCTAQVAGATGHYISEINNTYAWNNTLNGSVVNMGARVGFQGCGIAENVNFWNYNPSFTNNTNGIGRGVSNPATTGNPDGSAYWVNATATPSVDPTVVQAGHLYKRVSGAWVDYYTPYTYPHPLRAGTSPTPSPTPPAPLLFIQLFPDV